MKKRIKKWLNALLAIALVLGSLQYTPMQSVDASEGTSVTYAASDMTVAGGNASVSAETYSLSFASQYQEVFLKIPEKVELSEVKTITFKVADQTDSLNFYVGADNGAYWADKFEEYYGKTGATEYTVTPADGKSGAFDYIGVQNGGAGEASAKFMGVTIVMDDDTEKTYAASDMSKAGGNATVTASGNYVVKFASQYQEAFLKIPQAIELSEVESITFKVPEQSNTLNFYVGTDNGEYWAEKFDEYGGKSGATEYTVTPAEGKSGAFDYIGIQNAANEAASAKFESVTIVMKPVKVVTEKYYTFADMTNSGGWGYGAFVNSKGGLYACYSSQYGEAKYDLPAGIELATLEKITLDVTEGNTADMFLKLYVDGTKVQEAGGTSIEVSADTITALASATKVTLGIQSNASSVAGYKIDNVLIQAVQDGGAEAEPDTADEAVDKAYTFAKLVDNGTGYGYTKEVSAEGAISISYNGQYQEARYDLPTAVDATTLQSIIVNVSGGTAGDLAVKLMADGEVVQTSYSPVVVLSSDSAAKVAAATTVSVAIMNNASAAADYVFDSITFRAVHVEEGPVEKYYTFNDMTNSGGWGYGAFVNSKGGLYACYSSQYGEAKYDLPVGIELATLEKITLDVTEGNASDMFLKLYVDGTNKQEAGGTSIEINEATAASLAGATKVTLGIQSNAASIASYKVDNVLITAKQTGGAAEEPDTADEATNKAYTFNEITDNGTGYGYTKEVSTEGAISISYNGQYQEARYDLPTAVDATTLQSIIVNVSGGTAGDLAVKLMADGEAIQTSYSPVVVLSSDSAAKVAAATTVSVAIMNNASGAADYVFDSITFRAVHDTTSGDEGGEEGDEPLDAQYTFADVKTDVAAHNATISVDENGVATIDFSANYGQVAFTFPEDLDTSLITSLELVGEDVSGLALKVYADEEFSDFDAQEKVEYNSSMSINTALTGTLNYFVIMNTSGDAKTYKLSGFNTTVAQAQVETYELTFNAGEGENDLIFQSLTGGATQVLEGNAHSLTFATYNSDEVKFTIPELINMEKCVNITVNVADQVGPMNYYFYSGSTKLGQKYYNPENAENKHLIEFNPKLTGKMDTLGVQLGGNEATEGAKIKILSVTFVMEGKKPVEAPTDGVYTYAHFEEAETDGAAVAVDEESLVATIDFDEEGSSVTFPVPDAIDLNHLVSIDMIAEGAESVKIVLLDKDGEEISSTMASSIETKCNPEIAFVKLVATEATNIELTGLKFNVDPEAFESIILNGNFAREDVSMWKNALWGTVDGTEDGEPTTITAVTGDEEIEPGVYTYGVLSRRSSPYVCFAQDVTERVKKGQQYTIGFLVKLSEDYADVGDHMRMPEISCYYVDENGKEQYGLRHASTPKRVAYTDKWTYISCEVTVPNNAQKFVVRLVEQGTNYGQGECALGSYYVTGVRMYENNIPQSYGGGGGSSANTTITKEATWIESYDMDDLLVEWASATNSKSGSSLNMKFKNNYDEVRMDLPRELDASTMAYVKTKVSSNVPMAVKLYYKGSQVDVGYYNTIKDEYTLVPTYTGMVDAIGIMSLATPNPADAWAKFTGIEFGLTQEPAPLPPRTSIVLNGDFSNEDLADWKASFWGDGVTMTRKTSSTEIAPGVKNYGSYSKRTSPYQCFAQDITEAVTEGETYNFSFWARLSNDYKGAPDTQRVIQFAPYTVDSNGNADYNPRLDGKYIQVCEPGEWTYFEGTYKVTNPNDVSKVVIRILEQGTDYGQGECVLGGFDVADVKMSVYVPEPPSIDEDVPNLKDALAEDFGDDFWTGTAMTLDEMEDIGVEMLVNKHFNAVTLGNELKPDCLFNYSNGSHTDLKTVTFNGQELVVPTLYFNRADEMLDELLKWNATHPESPIKVKGHVLVWHSQTPEWFFRENYVVGNNADGTPNYVSAEEMDLRLEWFISEVFNHYLGADSPYKDMFYAWDVVNEAVSNGNTGYRTDKASAVEDPNADTHSANSSWWAVYQSNQYIINAFKYANKYAPANVELYYNDYNECDSSKMKGIVQLLTDVKNAEGTRIDGMGMQGHYNMFNPSIKDIEKAIRAYAEVVGKVNYSELDMKAAGDISNETKLQDEYLAQAERYHDIYQVLLKLDAEDGIEINGITWWGTVDHHSWLQDSSDVGGGADGTMTHCPLLFDTKYKVKPSYWAFVDYTQVDPDWAPESEETPEVEEPKEDTSKEEPTEEPVAEDKTSTEESKTAESEEKAEDTSSTPKKSKSVAPFAIAGGAGAAIIAASAAFLFRKKKK